MKCTVGHVFAVGAHGRRGRSARVALRQPEMATRDDDAGGEPLQILFPWSGKRLVEVVDVENDVALRRGKGAEIQQVRVAAGLHA